MQTNRTLFQACPMGEEEQTLHLWDVEGSFEPDLATWPSRPAEDWEENALGLAQALTGALLRKWQETARLEAMERELVLLRQRVTELERSAPVCVPVETLAPEPYELVKPFHVVIQAQGGEYVASFYDANLHASGATEEGALANLKETVVDVFELLSEHDASQLGPEPRRQLEVLNEFMTEAV